MADRLIMFSGTECGHCKEMYPLIDKAEKELKVKITRLEVWHNSENASFMQGLDKDDQGKEFCGGVPFFYNEKSKKMLCGSVKYDTLKAWAQDK
jgi:thiol-disulfide isomerase/thioredoxin